MRNIDSTHMSPVRRASKAAWAAALISGIFLGMASTVHAQASAVPWNLVDSEATMPVLGEGHSGIVFMKLQENDLPVDPTSGKSSTPSVFVDGTYHASLPKASWTYAEVCPGTHILSAAQEKAMLAITEEQPGGQRYEFAAATVSYFQLRQDSQGMPQLQALEAGPARAAVEQLPKAVHTISRLQAKDCAQPTAVPLPVQNTSVVAVARLRHVAEDAAADPCVQRAQPPGRTRGPRQPQELNHSPGVRRSDRSVPRSIQRYPNEQDLHHQTDHRHRQRSDHRTQARPATGNPHRSEGAGQRGTGGHRHRPGASKGVGTTRGQEPPYRFRTWRKR